MGRFAQATAPVPVDRGGLAVAYSLARRRPDEGLRRCMQTYAPRYVSAVTRLGSGLRAFLLLTAVTLAAIGVGVPAFSRRSRRRLSPGSPRFACPRVTASAHSPGRLDSRGRHRARHSLGQRQSARRDQVRHVDGRRVDTPTLCRRGRELSGGGAGYIVSLLGGGVRRLHQPRRRCASPTGTKEPTRLSSAQW